MKIPFFLTTIFLIITLPVVVTSCAHNNKPKMSAKNKEIITYVIYREPSVHDDKKTISIYLGKEMIGELGVQEYLEFEANKHQKNIVGTKCNMCESFGASITGNQNEDKAYYRLRLLKRRNQLSGYLFLMDEASGVRDIKTYRKVELVK